MKIPILFGGLLLVLFSCGERKTPEVDVTADKPVKIKDYIPFTEIKLDDLSNFKAETVNWQIVGDVYVDRSVEKKIETTPGVGVLVNQPLKDGDNGHVLTSFDHGDIEMELEVMMPVNSNSGLYFQGRYEVQLFDSWGQEAPSYSDMGGIYQRWDDANGEGKEGFEGNAPKVNASKSPGLWQHYKIIFHAPRFDNSGAKIKNAIFQEVWLNGELIQEDVEVTGPTRSASFEDEKPRGPLMIQGDHGPVALKNIKYKLYEDKKISLSDMMMTEYENNSDTIARLDTLTVVQEINTDTISAKMVTGDRVKRILKYQGNMNIPNPGTYLFDFRINNGGGLLLIDNDTVINLNGSYTLKEPGITKVELDKGIVPFTFIYNKHNPWNIGFGLEVEGPEMQKFSLAANGSLSGTKRGQDNNIVIELMDEVTTQRGYMMHNGEKRTHCIGVGSPNRINYSYDLSREALLQVWQGDFLDVTQMWHARGNDQLAEPIGFSVSFHGDPDFMILENKDTVWPDSIPSNMKFKQLGYEIGDNGLPTFLHQIERTTISNTFKTTKDGRGIERTINIKGGKDIWHKIAEGESIKELEDGTFIVNNESYFIDFSESDGLVPMVRYSNGRDELLLKITSGNKNIKYTIIW